MADTARSLAFLRHLLAVTLEEARADPDGHPQAPELLAEALGMALISPRPIPLTERPAARALVLRFQVLQPGSKRIWVHASRRRGRDARLLLCECFLAAIYRTRGADDPWYDAHWDGAVILGPELWGFYRVGAHFIARWDDLRFVWTRRRHHGYGLFSIGGMRRWRADLPQRRVSATLLAVSVERPVLDEGVRKS